MSHEFLITNGLGGYCSSSINERNTRKYHGLLIIPDKNLNRFLTVSCINEKIFDDEHVFDLGVNHYAPNTVYPHGYQYITSFDHAPFPTWEYTLPNKLKARKRITMLKNVTVIEYKLQSPKQMIMQFFPFITYRNIYDLGTVAEFNQKVSSDKKRLFIKINTQGTDASIAISNDTSVFNKEPHWYHNFEYPMDHINGDYGTEDLWNPGYFETKIPKGKTKIQFILSAEPKDGEKKCKAVINSISAKKRFFVSGKIKIPNGVRKNHSLFPLYERLIKATDVYVIEHEKKTKIIAGYPFFKDWGRDSFISLKGLLLIPERFNEAKNLLLSFANKEKNGLLPNRVTGVTDYHTIDASLWFILACIQYFDETQDKPFIRTIFPVVQNILKSYENGTHNSIQMDKKDGCIFWSDPNENLSWMDGQVDNTPVLNRSGKAVEIQALWYNALLMGAEMADMLKKESKHWNDIAKKLKDTFLDLFWNTEKTCLYDSVKETYKDDSIRPNQLYAVSLPYPLIEGKLAKQIVEICKEKLLTKVGLRTLSPDNPGYHGVYQGSRPERDKAYHNGTVWPFLLGPYFHAYLRVEEFSAKSIQNTIEFYKKFESGLDEQCAGQISEIYEADTLMARGCFAQAWSVAQNLEVVDVLARQSV